MDAKKKIMQFIGPNWIPGIVMIIIFPLAFFGLIHLLFIALPANNTAKRCLKKLEENGQLEQAAAELTSHNAKQYMDGKLILTDHFVFCKKSGQIFTYDEFVWIYRHTFTQRVLLIPIRVTESLYASTMIAKTGKPSQAYPIASMGKDKMDQIKNAMVEIYNHNRNCMIGYSDQNIAVHKQMLKK